MKTRPISGTAILGNAKSSCRPAPGTRLRLALVVASLLAAGCAGTAPDNGNVTPLMERDYGSACARQGHTPGTAGYRACILAYPSNESAEERTRRIRDPM